MGRVGKYASMAAALALILALPLVAFAAGQGEHGGDEHAPGIDLTKLLFQFANFGVLLFILIKFGGKAVNGTLKARHQKMKADLEASTRALSEARARLKQQQAAFESLEIQVQELRGKLKEDAANQKALLIAAAEEKARKIQDETKFLMEQQVKQAERSFKSQVAAATVKIAAELVAKSVNQGDQSRLVDNFVEDINNAPTQGAR